MEVSALGDSALIVRVRERFDDAPKKALDEVLEVARRLDAAKIPGVIELAPAYTTVTVFFDPLLVAGAGAKPDEIFAWLTNRVVEATRRRAGREKRDIRDITHEIPVCYDPEFAPDLDRVAQHAQIPIAEIAQLHSSAEYRVSCIGFTPGFPFLTGLPSKLATPRRDSPRNQIPAGSVAIGASQTGIYPAKSPGGWNIIGRTPLKLFDPEKNPPTLLRIGDRVRFRAINREEFDKV